MDASFAIPGDINARTGGYGYARRLLREAPGAGIDLVHVALPVAGPLPSPEHLSDIRAVFSGLPNGAPALIDGLVFGTLPPDVLKCVSGPAIALCHHPLALETGLDPGLASQLHESERTALSCASGVVTTSNATAKILVSDYGVPVEKITVAPPGTDPAPRASLAGTGTCKILSVGSITPRKGHHLLLRALPDPDDAAWSLTIAGGVQDAGYLALLKEIVADRGIADRVTLAGVMDSAALTEAYQTSDLFVLASKYEGFGMAFVEAMSHGLPVIGLECDAVAEATKGAAVLVRPEDLSGTLSTHILSTDARMALSDRCWLAAQTFLRWRETASIVAGALAAAPR